ncbi:MAG TPA: glycosyltransferase family 39 protein, partial [Thermodesulfovibrionales bacterium]|nr:glycosyltransferase family 39 protein [Thermodesulfovibrionales bacterium]
INEFSARFPSALSAFSLCLALFLFVGHFRGPYEASLVAITFALSLYFVVYSHAAVTDMALTLFIALSLMSFYLSVAGERTSKTTWYVYGFYLFSAFAFLTKGLIGILFPFGIAACFLLLTRGVGGLRKLLFVRGILLFLAVSLPWYVAQLAINGQEFIQQFFIKHHFKRYTGVISGHRGPVYYYIAALILGLLPWIVFLPRGIRNTLMCEQGENAPLPGSRDTLGLFALIWLIFIFVFFSLSTTKLPNYILPAIPAAFILVASGMADIGTWRRHTHIAGALIVALMGFAFLIAPTYLLRFGIHTSNWTIQAALILFGLAALFLYGAFSEKKVYSIIAVFMFAYVSLLMVEALPLVHQHLQGPLYKYSLYAKERLAGDERILTYGINNPSIVFYSGHRVVRVGNRDELLPLMGEQKRLFVITKAKEVEGLKNLGFNLFEQDGRYAILEKQ